MIASQPSVWCYLLQARAVGCGFILTEARGAVGRMFKDLPSGRGNDRSSRSFREALFDPRISTHSHQQHHGDRHHSDERPMAPTPPKAENLHHQAGASRPLPPRHSSANARDSVLSGLVSSSKYTLQQGTQAGEGAAASASAARYAQLHVCLQALHVFWQEHGHFPVVLDWDQADEIVRIANELVETGKHVSGSSVKVWVHFLFSERNQGSVRLVAHEPYPHMGPQSQKQKSGCVGGAQSPNKLWLRSQVPMGVHTSLMNAQLLL